VVLFSFTSLSCKRMENACKPPVCCRGALCMISGRSDRRSLVTSCSSLYFVCVRICGLLVGDEEGVSCLGRRTSPPVGRHPF
jgi:hypothetical protein